MNELKSAEELGVQVRDVLRFYSTYPNAEERQLICLQERIKQIQLNAYRAGMTEAVKIMENSELETDDGYKAYKQMKESILSERDRKTL